MNKTLEDRLSAAKGVLDQVHALMARHPGRLPTDVEDSVRKVIDQRVDIDHWLGLLKARETAFQLLDGLEVQADSNDLVNFGSVSAKFQYVRLIGVQAYMTTTWALADRVTGLVGRVLCTPEAGFNAASPVQLVSNFIQQTRKKTTAAALFESVRQAFGWPIGLSYAIRNHFVHDGAQTDGADFFEGPSAVSAFRISTDGWLKIESKASSEYKVEPSWHRAGVGWPTTPRNDLRVVLKVCERDLDDALGILLGSACNSLRIHIGFMLGED